ncbi:hypothetical protein CUJ83_12635 [Methanocella sp. CWC-04]|uniref:Uncharacterized protein n=2 Tax=Methanooceanicella nereidis TaxID=2052831 RepID=A0AAP2W6Z8_9EURY|nr:hypothetical protein [Methanocella sp. CWC-04]
MIPLNRISSLDIDISKEIDRIIGSCGKHSIPKDRAAIQKVSQTYENLKTLGFFDLVARKFNNNEHLTRRLFRYYDMFEGDAVSGKIFFIVEFTKEAMEAFLDDGQVALKLREWLVSSYKELFDLKNNEKDLNNLELWNKTFSGKNSRLPSGVKAIPFYKEDLCDGIPALIIVLVKETEHSNA